MKEEHIDKSTANYMEEICAICGARRGLHNHMNQRCPQEPLTVTGDHTEYATTIFSTTPPIHPAGEEKGDPHKIFRDNFALAIFRQLEESLEDVDLHTYAQTKLDQLKTVLKQICDRESKPPPPSQQDRSVSQPGGEAMWDLLTEFYQLYINSENLGIEWDAFAEKVGSLVITDKESEAPEGYHWSVPSGKYHDDEPVLRKNRIENTPQPSQPGEGKEWKPMNLAPKDGTEIIMSYDDKGEDVTEAYWAERPVCAGDKVYPEGWATTTSTRAGKDLPLDEGIMWKYPDEPPLPEQGKEEEKDIVNAATEYAQEKAHHVDILIDAFVSGVKWSQPRIELVRSGAKIIEEANEKLRRELAALKSRPSEGWSDTQLKDFGEYCDNHEGNMENLFKQWKNKWL